MSAGNGFGKKGYAKIELYQESRSRLDIRKKFLAIKVVRHCHRLTREAVHVPSMEMFKVSLVGALGNLI